MASVITLAFEGWKAQEAATGKPVLLNEFVFANIPNLDPTKPIDRNEKLPPANQIVHRQAVNKSGLVSENAVAYSVTLGADVGDFDFNWIGLLNKESGTVAMITHAPIQKKLKTQNGQQGNVLIRSFLLEFNGAAEETQIKTSAETWQIDFTARLTGMDEMQRLINVDNYGAAAFFNDGFEVTRSGEQFTVKKGLGYVGGLRGQLEQNQILNGLRNTKIYADFSYQGNIVSQWSTVIKITSAATLSNYVDAAGFTHQVFAIASIDASGNVKDLRPKGAINDQALDELRKQTKLDLNGKVDKEKITQQKGNSKEHIISQDLFTVEIGKLQPTGNYALRGESYPKDESDKKYQPAGNYAPEGDYATNKALNDGLSLKLDKEVKLIPSEINALDYIASQDSGFFRTGGASIGVPVPGAWNDFIWIKHGELHGRLLCLISNNKLATNTFAATWLGWDIVPTSQDIIDAVSQVNSRVTSLENKVDNLPLLGVNQLYREVSGRTVGVNYTNTGNKPIFVSIIFNNQNSIYRTVSIDNNPIITINGTPEADQPGAVTFIVPIQSSYKVETNGSVNKWIELS